MQFFFADSLDLVDPTFDFTTEERSEERVRQRDDLYPHELFAEPPYDGMLVSKAIVDGVAGGGSAKYTMAQRQRLLRMGARRFLRLENSALPIMGDCGAFSYVREHVPPYKAEEVADFYQACGFDLGLSVDHVILEFDETLDQGLGLDVIAPVWKHRQQLTLELAQSFLAYAKRRRLRFRPIGVVQGWSPQSYANAALALQKMGYHRLALGGLVPLKTAEIHAILMAVEQVRAAATTIHLLGVTRLTHLKQFQELGATSFDTTSPLRQAFKDDKDNYHTGNTTYVAVRVPQVDANPSLLRRIRAGQVSLDRARQLEQRSLAALRAFNEYPSRLAPALEAVLEYEGLWDGTKDRSAAYRRTLEEAPWRSCPCEVCKSIGVHVVLFRGAERNRRRGFHNLKVLKWQLDAAQQTEPRQRRATARNRGVAL